MAREEKFFITSLESPDEASFKFVEEIQNENTEIEEVRKMRIMGEPKKRQRLTSLTVNYYTRLQNDAYPLNIHVCKVARFFRKVFCFSWW